jgi:hypothetical protein
MPAGKEIMSVLEYTKSLKKSPMLKKLPPFKKDPYKIVFCFRRLQGIRKIFCLHRPTIRMAGEGKIVLTLTLT